MSGLEPLQILQNLDISHCSFYSVVFSSLFADSAGASGEGLWVWGFVIIMSAVACVGLFAMYRWTLDVSFFPELDDCKIETILGHPQSDAWCKIQDND